jgi:copper(I)-binding protein/uncharacterized protein YcnI
MPEHQAQTRRTSVSLVLAAATAVMAGAITPAAAHVSIAGLDEVASGSTVELRFRVPHGCDGAPTDRVEVAFPEGIVAVQPAWLPGWTIATESVPAEPYSIHGVQHSQRVGTVTWSEGSLPDGLYLDFTVTATILAEPGVVAFPVVQHCSDASIAWIGVPQADDPAAAVEDPAPTVTVVAGDASSSDHDHEHASPDAGGAASSGDLEISGAWVREAMIPGRPTAGYLTIHNGSDTDDAIVGATSPAAGVIELHETTTADDGTMGMGPVPEIPVPAHGEAALEPGGYHLMILEPTAPLTDGDSVELTLTFAAAEPVTMSVPVKAAAPMVGMDHMEH